MTCNWIGSESERQIESAEWAISGKGEYVILHLFHKNLVRSAWIRHPAPGCFLYTGRDTCPACFARTGWDTCPGLLCSHWLGHLPRLACPDLIYDFQGFIGYYTCYSNQNKIFKHFCFLEFDTLDSGLGPSPIKLKKAKFYYFRLSFLKNKILDI